MYNVCTIIVHTCIERDVDREKDIERDRKRREGKFVFVPTFKVYSVY